MESTGDDLPIGTYTIADEQVDEINSIYAAYIEEVNKLFELEQNVA